MTGFLSVARMRVIAAVTVCAFVTFTTTQRTNPLTAIVIGVGAGAMVLPLPERWTYRD